MAGTTTTGSTSKMRSSAASMLYYPRRPQKEYARKNRDHRQKAPFVVEKQHDVVVRMRPANVNNPERHPAKVNVNSPPSAKSSQRSARSTGCFHRLEGQIGTPLRRALFGLGFNTCPFVWAHISMPASLILAYRRNGRRDSGCKDAFDRLVGYLGDCIKHRCPQCRVPRCQTRRRPREPPTGVGHKPWFSALAMLVSPIKYQACRLSCTGWSSIACGCRMPGDCTPNPATRYSQPGGKHDGSHAPEKTASLNSPKVRIKRLRLPGWHKA